jgi:hypothetical protein
VKDDRVSRQIYLSGARGIYPVGATTAGDSFESSRGLALVSDERLRDPTFLEITGASKGPGKKSETLRAWRQDGEERRTLFEIPSLSWSRDDHGAELLVTRVTAAPGGIRIAGYRVRVTWLPDAARATGELLHVESPYGLQLAEIESIAPTEERFEPIAGLE